MRIEHLVVIVNASKQAHHKNFLFFSVYGDYRIGCSFNAGTNYWTDVQGVITTLNPAVVSICVR